MKDLLGDAPFPYRGEAPSQAHSPTSVAAAASIQKAIGPLHREILDYLAVRPERRGDGHHEILELRVFDRRKKCIGNCSDDRFVVSDFVLQEGLVELSAFEAHEFFHNGGVLLHAVVVFRWRGYDAELLGKVATLLTDLLVVTREHRAKIVGTEACDHPTDKQLIAMARTFFTKLHASA